MKVLSLTLLAIILSFCAFCQDISAKERADYLAKNEFSKAKYMKKERYGVGKELNKVIVSTPVVNNDLSFYQGNYISNDLDYGLEIRQDAQQQMMATLTQGALRTPLKNVIIKDAYFSAIKINADGTEEKWEGAFINKNDNDVIDFGLGIKLPNPVHKEGLQITKIFFKKVSP
jgi:hypothetical protein